MYEIALPNLPYSLQCRSLSIYSAVFPMSDFDSTNPPAQRRFMARTKCSLVSIHGGRSSRTWHKSAFKFQALSGGIFLAMIACFTVSSTRGGAIGSTEVFSGKCSHAININRFLQAVLALLAIGISVSFDFFMRLASSPTVEDLREAHSQGRSFDIGVHSLRNVRYIPHWRTAGWIMLILLAFPVQLFSHSIAFIAFSTTGYSRFIVNEAFMTGQPFAYPGVALLNNSLTQMAQSRFYEVLPIFESESSKWDKLEVSDCRHIYSQDLEGLQSHRNLLVVIETGPDADAKGWQAAQVWNESRLLAQDDDLFSEYDLELENSLWSFAISCYVNRDDFLDNGGFIQCSASDGNPSYPNDYDSTDIWGQGTVGDTSNVSWLRGSYNESFVSDAFQIQRVKYCLSEPYSAPCKIYLSNFFLVVTLLCVLLGWACSILIVRFCWDKETCQSLGDALQVFLKDGESLVQVPGSFPTGCRPEGTSPPSTRWTPVSKWEETRPRWGQAMSKKMWLWTYMPIGALLLGGSAALGALGEDISYVPNPLLCKQSDYRLTRSEIRLYLWREPQQ